MRPATPTWATARRGSISARLTTRWAERRRGGQHDRLQPLWRARAEQRQHRQPHSAELDLQQRRQRHRPARQRRDGQRRGRSGHRPEQPAKLPRHQQRRAQRRPTCRLPTPCPRSPQLRPSRCGSSSSWWKARSGRARRSSAPTVYTQGTTPTAIIPAGAATAGGRIVATATDANGNTSEFSAIATVASPLTAPSSAPQPWPCRSSRRTRPAPRRPSKPVARARWMAASSPPLRRKPSTC